MNFKIATAINLFRVLQLRSHGSLDRDTDVFFKWLYGCSPHFLPCSSSLDQVVYSLPLGRDTSNGWCCGPMLYFCGLFISRSVDKVDCG